MSRKKQFVVEEVKQKAMLSFWDHGYRGTSLQDLAETMRISRTSLDDTFGDKYALFVETLHSYDKTVVKPFLTRLTKTNSPRQAIIALFGEVCDLILTGEKQNGCFMINTALELSPHDKRMSKIVRQTFTYIETNFFRKMIKQGQATGEISKSVNSVTTSRALMTILIGVRVLSRNHPEKALLDSIRDQVAALLPPGDQATLPPASGKRNRSKVHTNVAYAE